METKIKKDKSLFLFLFIFLTSFSALTLEITYVRIFSVLTYYHFTSMIISVALLAFGAAGAAVSIKFQKEKIDDSFLGKNFLFFFVSILFTFYLIIKINFFPLEWGQDWTNQIALLFFYLAMGLPFYFAGLVLSALFSRYPERANFLYFSDLVGAGLGSLGTVLAFNILSAPLILHLLALLGLLFLISSSFFSKIIRIASLVFLFVFLFLFYKIVAENPLLVYPPPSKSLFNYAPPWKGKGNIEYSKWNVIERVDVTKSIKQNVWGFGGEISPLFLSRECELRYIFKDGIMSSGIMKIDKPIHQYEFLSGYLMAAPYYMHNYRSAMVIGLGGGIDALIALYHNVNKIVGVELNPEKVKLLEKNYYRYSGKLKDKIQLVPWEGRHFLSRFKGKVDVITTSGLDDYPALSSGSYAMSENYIFTVEAMIAMLDHLTERGVISVTRVYFDPPRETFKLVTTMKEALQRLGGADPWKHFLIVKGKMWENAIFKKTPFESQEVEKIKEWANKMQFDFMYLPYEKKDNPIDQYLRLPRSEEKKFIKNYRYKISPATDNSPFFFQYYKWRNLFKEKTPEWTYFKLPPLGLRILLFSLIQVTLFGLIFIGVPLSSIKLPKQRNWLLPMGYFASIGLGYILIEIVLIQRFNYFLGGAAYALAVTLFALLPFSGLGSYLAGRKETTRKFFIIVLLAIIGVSLLYLMGLDLMLKILMPFSRSLRIVAAALLIAPLGIFMGMPFPSGIKMLKIREMEMIVPWSWGVNSIFTVFGSVFCLLVSLNWGFSVAFLLGIISYALALACSSNFYSKG